MRTSRFAMAGFKGCEVHLIPVSPGKEEVLSTLRRLKPEIAEEFGIRQLSVFGSVARGEPSGGSDVDVLVEFDGVPTLFEMARLQERLEAELGTSVDLVTPGGLRPRTRSRAKRDAVRV